MFEQLSDRLRETLRKVRGQARLTEDNMRTAMREVRIALLEADVSLPVVKEFIARVRERALGADVTQSVTPGQLVIKIVHDELVAIMGESNDRLDLAARPPAVILVAGLQGAGKTTTVAKLALWIKQHERKRILVATTDVYRPAAIEQLKTLASTVDVEFFPASSEQDPVSIARNALKYAGKGMFDVLLVDSAGRLHVDQEMMAEIRAVHEALHPVETLFVVDSMTGQDAVHSASAFHETLPLTGVILTKTDGDARGGAALSIRSITGKPIKFLGTGEKIEALEAFHPDRVASRILGMGDVLTLVEQVQQKVDRKEAERLAKKISKGKGFDLEDFRDQILQMENMGGIASLVEKLPGIAGIPDQALKQVDNRQMQRTVAIINSMTPRERANPSIIRGSRKRRIAVGSGTQIQEVNRLLKQFTQMQKMMKKMRKGGGMAGLLQGMRGRRPGLPF